MTKQEKIIKKLKEIKQELEKERDKKSNIIMFKGKNEKILQKQQGRC